MMPGQRERLEQLGITALPPAEEVPAKARKGGPGAFERGVAGLRQYKARTGTLTVPRGHVETLPDGTQVKLGVWLTNTKTRRTKLTVEKKAVLAELGLDWAT
ncbi:helicase associated domain-containing protein [Streptomyces platensis]